MSLLRSLGLFWCGFYKDSAPTALGITRPMPRCFSTVHDRSRTTKPRPARQSRSLSGRAQTSRRRLAMTRQAVSEISMPIHGLFIFVLTLQRNAIMCKYLANITNIPETNVIVPSKTAIGFFSAQRIKIDFNIK